MASSEIMKLTMVLEGKDNLSKVIEKQLKLLVSLDRDANKAVNSLNKLFNLSAKGNNFSFGKKFSSDINKSNAEALKLKKTLESITNLKFKTPKIQIPKIDVPKVRIPTKEADWVFDQLKPKTNTRKGKEELDKLFNERQKSNKYIRGLANLNERVFEPTSQIKNAWKGEYDSLKQYTDEASKLLRLQGRFKSINLPEAENQKAFAAVRENVKNIRGISLADSQELFTSIYNALGNVDAAIEALPMASKYKVASSALYGDIYSPEEVNSQIQKGFKFLELTGATKDRATMESRFDVLTKVLSSTGGEVTMAKFLAMGKQASPIMQTVTDKGIYNTSAVIDVMGGDRVGTALSALNRAWVGGIMKQPVAERYQELGLIKEGGIEYNKSGKLKSIKPGANILGDAFVKDPLEASKILANAIRADAAKKGIDVSTPEGMNKQMRGLFGTETQYRLANEFINNLGQVEKESQRAQNSKGAIDSYNTLNKENSPLLKIEEYETALKNFKANAALPLIQALGKVADSATPILTFFGEHEEIAKWTMYLLLAGKGLKFVSETATILNSGGRGLMSFFNGATESANKTGLAADKASKKVGNFKNSLSSFGKSQTVSLGVNIAAVYGIDYLIGKINQAVQTAYDAGNAQENVSKQSKNNYQLFQQTEKVLKENGKSYDTKDFQFEANIAWATALKSGLELALKGEQYQKMPLYSWNGESKFSYAEKQTGLHWLSKLTGSENKFLDWGMTPNKQSIGRGFKEFTPQLNDPRIMMELLKQLPQRTQNEGQQKIVKEGLQQQFPDSFAIAVRELATVNFAPLTQSLADLSNQSNSQKQSAELLAQFGQTITKTEQPFSVLNQNVGTLGETAGKANTPLSNFIGSLNGIANNLNGVSNKLANFTVPTPKVQTFSLGIPSGNNQGNSVSSLLGIPSKATGGTVKSEGFVYVHAGEDIMPADVTSRYRAPNRSGVNLPSASPSPTSGVTIQNHFTINVNGNDVADKTLKQIESACRKIIKEEMNPDVLAAKISKTTGRFSERV